MVCSTVSLVLLAFTAALAAPSPMFEEYTEIIPKVTEKRAALVLDRLLIALQKALHEEGAPRYARPDREGPRASPLRYASDDVNDLSALQRRGQGTGRGRVLRCYFNAVTCF